jgi:hypothetical protein
LNTEPREKVYTTTGPEFSAELQGRPALIVQALYGLKSSGAAWRLLTLGFTSSLAVPDVRYRENTKPDGSLYFEYVLE